RRTKATTATPWRAAMTCPPTSRPACSAPVCRFPSPAARSISVPGRASTSASTATTAAPAAWWLRSRGSAVKTYSGLFDSRPGLHPAFQYREGQGAAAEDEVVEVADVEVIATGLASLFPQFQDLQHAYLVGRRLAGPAQVVLYFRADCRLRLR